MFKREYPPVIFKIHNKLSEYTYKHIKIVQQISNYKLVIAVASGVARHCSVGGGGPTNDGVRLCFFGEGWGDN